MLNFDHGQQGWLFGATIENIVVHELKAGANAFADVARAGHELGVSTALQRRGEP